MFRNALAILALTMFATPIAVAQDLQPRPLRFGLGTADESAAAEMWVAVGPTVMGLVGNAASESQDPSRRPLRPDRLLALAGEALEDGAPCRGQQAFGAERRERSAFDNWLAMDLSITG